MTSKMVKVNRLEDGSRKPCGPWGGGSEDWKTTTVGQKRKGKKGVTVRGVWSNIITVI